MLHVLIVDDSLIIRKHIRQELENLGHIVIGEAKNATEAISLYSRLEVDLVTMDITMEGLDGIYATKEILKKNKHTKVIMVTSHGKEEMITDAIKAGASGYLLKPITEDKLSEVLEKIFDLEDYE